MCPVLPSRHRSSRAPNSHYLCNVRLWLRQGLGCSRADPRGILSLSACSLTCCVFARAEEDLSSPLQTPCGSRARLATSPSAWSWFRRATCGPLLYVAGQASKVCTETSFCTSLWAWLPAIVHSSALDRRVTASASGSRSRRSSVRVVTTLECDLHSFLRSCPRSVRVATCLVVSGHFSTQTCLS